jgi:hypothetical protein
LGAGRPSEAKLAALWVVTAIFGFQINLETIKALKEAFPLF